MSRLIASIPSLPPVPLAGDPAVASFAEFRRSGLRRLAALLRTRLAPAESENLDAGLLLSEMLTSDEWTALVLRPHYSYWWARLSRAIGRGSAEAVSALMPELSRQLLIPLARRSQLDGMSVILPPAVSGTVRFPGLPRHLVATGFADGRGLRADVRGGLLRITDGTVVREVNVAVLLGSDGSARPAGIFQRARIPGTCIEVDATDPWILDFVEAENTTRPSPGRSRDDMEPCGINGAGLRRLAASLAGIETAWPAMRREILDYVHLIVPFRSEVRAAFTNVSWHGAVFLRATLDNEVANIERLVHETSHLRLNLLMTTAKLHEHAPAECVPSPFRAGPRPVAGLYHGAFVVTRAAIALDQFHRLNERPCFAERIPILLAQIGIALATLRREVRLTPSGAALLDEVEAHFTALSAVYGVADPQEPKVYEEL